MRTDFSGTQKFTLMELLTVIAVIAILAGLLLPAMGRSREQGRGSACLSNLKQIGAAYLIYSSDYGCTVKIWNSGSSRWMNTLADHSGITVPVCPSDRRPGRENHPSYGPSYVLSANPEFQGKEYRLWYNVREKNIRYPSQFILLSGISDSYYFGNGTVSEVKLGQMNGELSAVDGFCKNLSFRHSSGNFQFYAGMADGHVAFFRFYEMSDKYWDLQGSGGYGGGK